MRRSPLPSSAASHSVLTNGSMHYSLFAIPAWNNRRCCVTPDEPHLTHRRRDISSAAMTNDPTASLTQLGHRVDAAASPDEARLEYVANPRPGADYLIRFSAPEFT